MGLNEELERMKFDTRLIDWNLKHRKIKTDDLNKHLSSIPDSAANVDTLDISPEAESLDSSDMLQ